jgi:hypothetical protein
MKKSILIGAALFSIISCRSLSPEKTITPVFVTDNGLVVFSFPEGWYQNQKKNPYDLQCFSKHQKMTTGVFLYRREDLAEEINPHDVLLMQIGDLKSKRKNFKVIESEKTSHVAGKTLAYIVYSAEKGLSRYIYRFTLVEFEQKPEIYSVVLQVALPSNWENHKPILEKITESVHVRGEKDHPGT